MGHYDDLYEFYKNKPNPLCMPKRTKIKSVKKLKQTNEEWLRSCSTEELAKFIVYIVEFGMPHELYEAIGHDKDKVIEWLKEEHDGNT